MSSVGWNVYIRSSMEFPLNGPDVSLWDGDGPRPWPMISCIILSWNCLSSFLCCASFSSCRSSNSNRFSSSFINRSSLSSCTLTNFLLWKCHPLTSFVFFVRVVVSLNAMLQMKKLILQAGVPQVWETFLCPLVTSSITICAVDNDWWLGGRPVAKNSVHSIEVVPFGNLPSPVLFLLSLIFLYSPLSFLTLSLHCLPVRSKPASRSLTAILSYTSWWRLQPSSWACMAPSPQISIN